MEQLDYFASEGFNEIDTARMYANGETEDMLGRILSGRDGISVTGATKELLLPLVRRRDAARQP